MRFSGCKAAPRSLLDGLDEAGALKAMTRIDVAL